MYNIQLARIKRRPNMQFKPHQATIPTKKAFFYIFCSGLTRSHNTSKIYHCYLFLLKSCYGVTLRLYLRTNGHWKKPAFFWRTTTAITGLQLFYNHVVILRLGIYVSRCMPDRKLLLKQFFWIWTLILLLGNLIYVLQI